MNNKNKKWLQGYFKKSLPVLLGVCAAGALVLGATNYDNFFLQLNQKKITDIDPVPSVPRIDIDSKSNACTFGQLANTCFKPKVNLCENDLRAAKIAWKYFENNYQPETGFVNSVDKYTSTTMWDMGSAIAATIAARDLGLISQKEFDDRSTTMISTLHKMPLFNGEAPNKVYNSKTMKMTTYGNKETPDGIGVSALDLARMISWLNTLSCKHPKYQHTVDTAIKRWNFDKIIKEGRMYGLKRNLDSGEIKAFQEGRLGYEQYAGKIFKKYGFSQEVASTYKNEYRNDVNILNTSIATDNRTPEKFGTNNSVVTESYVMDAMENGFDDENRPLIRNVFDVQKRRWEEQGIITAVSEDNIKKKPYFVYNTIFSGGENWVAKSSKGQVLKEHKTISTKAAIAMATLYPDDKYSAVLIDAVQSAYDPERGWYSGIYENGEGYNKSITANTNGVILSTLLYKKYGPTYNVCDNCSRRLITDKISTMCVVNK